MYPPLWWLCSAIFICHSNRFENIALVMCDFIQKFPWESKQLKTSNNMSYSTCNIEVKCVATVAQGMTHVKICWRAPLLYIYIYIYICTNIYLFCINICNHGMCMYIHVWIYVGANMSVHRLMLVVFLNHYSPLFFDTDLSLKPRPHWSLLSLVIRI
jgi:hypothetical protein